MKGKESKGDVVASFSGSSLGERVVIPEYRVEFDVNVVIEYSFLCIVGTSSHVR